MTWRKRKDDDDDPVSVSERLGKLPSADLEALAESSLMMAQESLTRMHMTSGVDKIFHLERAKVYANQADQALAIMWTRFAGS